MKCCNLELQHVVKQRSDFANVCNFLHEIKGKNRIEFNSN